MIGNAGPGMWETFSSDQKNAPHPLDTWTRRVLTPIANDLASAIVFPFEGPPYHPFQKWAMRADSVSPSPIGPLIHPVFGLWHAYRAALLFDDHLPLPEKASDLSPCDACPDKPCLETCPVDAFSIGHYDVPACRQHIAGREGADCLRSGCLARRVCPVGREYVYHPDQANFHMRHFLTASSG